MSCDAAQQLSHTRLHLAHQYGTLCPISLSPCLPVLFLFVCLLSPVGDHLAKSAAEFSYGTVMDEVRMLIQRRRLAVNDRQQRAVAFGEDRKRGGGLHL